MDNFKSILEVLNTDDSLSKFRDSILQADIVVRFPEIFPDLKKIAKAVKVDKKVLYLSVENSVWRSELKFKQKVIVDRINEHFNAQVIKSVKFVA